MSERVSLAEVAIVRAMRVESKRAPARRFRPIDWSKVSRPDLLQATVPGEHRAYLRGERPEGRVPDREPDCSIVTVGSDDHMVLFPGVDAGSTDDVLRPDRDGLILADYLARYGHKLLGGAQSLRRREQEAVEFTALWGIIVRDPKTNHVVPLAIDVRRCIVENSGDHKSPLRAGVDDGTIAEAGAETTGSGGGDAA